jgi:hypothetical protein
MMSVKLSRPASPTRRVDVSVRCDADTVIVVVDMAAIVALARRRVDYLEVIERVPPGG